jgi:hypothetical protein
VAARGQLSGQVAPHRAQRGLGKVSVSPITVQHLLVRSLVERDQAGHLALTDQGHDVLARKPGVAPPCFPFRAAAPPA